MSKAFLTALALAAPFSAQAQDLPVAWERGEGPTVARSTVFHSTQAANLPTAETLSAGEWLFEISHRFRPPVSEGSEALWGLDGPVFNRLGLAVALTDRLMVGLLRSNLDDNIDLSAKVRVADLGSATTPVMLGLAGGVALNPGVTVEGGIEDNETQAYGQLIVDALFADRFAVGVVPTVLRNPDLTTEEPETTFSLGLHGQVYLSDQLSLMGEWVASEAHTDLTHDTGTFGIELETGGHFFKLVLTNSERMNPSQILAGSEFEFTPDEWRLGFNVTRLLVF